MMDKTIELTYDRIRKLADAFCDEAKDAIKKAFPDRMRLYYRPLAVEKRGE